MAQPPATSCLKYTRRIRRQRTNIAHAAQFTNLDNRQARIAAGRAHSGKVYPDSAIASTV
jgi:hypothetical protein